MKFWNFLGNLMSENKPQSSKRFVGIYTLLAIITPICYWYAYKHTELSKPLIDSLLIFVGSAMALGVGKNLIEAKNKKDEETK